MIEPNIRYKFFNPALLELALSHPSSKKSKQAEDNERLEFLGDSILGFVISDRLYKTFKDEAEGDLAKRKAAIVCRKSLAEVAKTIELDKCLILGKGEDANGGRNNAANLENAMEALIAAVYLDSGIAEATSLIEEIFSDKINKMDEPPKDAKSLLQEYVQANGKPLPDYNIVSMEGPSHQPTIRVELQIEDNIVFEEGTSRKKAEHVAAKKMLDVLGVKY